MAGLTPPGNRGSFSTEKIQTRTRTNGFRVVKTIPLTSDKWEFLQRKCSDGKAYIGLLQLGPKDKLLLGCRVGSLKHFNFQNIFRVTHTASKRSGFWGKVTVSHSRVISEPNPPKPCVMLTERLVLNPFEIIDSPEAKTARFPWLWWPLFLLSLQIFLLCVARLESKNVLGWLYLYQRDLIAYSCMAWQQNMELNIPLEDY